MTARATRWDFFGQDGGSGGGLSGRHVRGRRRGVAGANAWLIVWAERYQRLEIERLHEEGCRLKEELMKLNGGEPIPLSPKQRRLLAEEAKGILDT